MSSSDTTTGTSSDKYIGLTLAILSSLLIGVSFVITKVGLNDASRGKRESAGESHSYLKNWKWWIGMAAMGCGEAANFAAYSFAPAILVTPLGALSVLIGAVLAAFFLNERLGRDGLIGCTLCLLGSLIIIFHAPSERPINSINEIMGYVLQPGFLLYTIFVTGLSLYLIYKVAPKIGKTNMLVYISICSLVGSISVMAVKAFGVALKLTIEGNNQLNNPATYVFAVIVAVSAITQMNYFNKALDIYSTNLVTPAYYVLFTTATITASIVMFQGFQDSSVVDIVSVFCGFATIFIGVFMLNSKNSLDKQAAMQQQQSAAIALTDRQRSVYVSAPTADPMARFDEENRPFKLRSEEDLDDD